MDVQITPERDTHEGEANVGCVFDDRQRSEMSVWHTRHQITRS
jgi:hypothetical protein